MKEKLEQFIANLNGQWVEVSDSGNKFQCLDLAYNWVFCLNFPKSTIQNLRAYEVFTKPKEITKKYFDLIKNTPEGIPQAGDLVVWDSKVGDGAGHIAIATGEGGLKQFTNFEQNWPVGAPASLRKHDYTNVLGWLRPRVSQILSVDEDLTLKFLKENWPKNKFEKLEAFARELVEVYKRPPVTSSGTIFTTPLASLLFKIALAIEKKRGD